MHVTETRAVRTCYLSNASGSYTSGQVEDVRNNCGDWRSRCRRLGVFVCFLNSLDFGLKKLAPPKMVRLLMSDYQNGKLLE